MVGAAHVAIEAVAGGVGEELLLGVRRGDLLHLLERDAGVLLPEMEHHRTGGALVAALVDAAAVVADDGSGIEPGGGEPGDGAAPAVADDGGLAGEGDETHDGGNVEQRCIPGDLGSDGAALSHVVLVVAELDAALDTVA